MEKERNTKETLLDAKLSFTMVFQVNGFIQHMNKLITPVVQFNHEETWHWYIQRKRVWKCSIMLVCSKPMGVITLKKCFICMWLLSIRFNSLKKKAFINALDLSQLSLFFQLSLLKNIHFYDLLVHLSLCNLSISTYKKILYKNTRI